jgi:hypothetical protein
MKRVKHGVKQTEGLRGADDGIRTRDVMLGKHALYR